MPASINTDRLSMTLRSRAVDVSGRRLLVTNLHGSKQELDLSEPANCQGFGRIRHFHRERNGNWPENPLPIAPAARALGLPDTMKLRVQVFQNAACNWRCWYCFVDFGLLAADAKRSAWKSAADLVDMYLAEPDPPQVIDLSGGQPDLVPEWIPWMMRELRSRGLANSVYLWSDDNLSNDYLWRFLSDADLELIATFPHYGRVCCFKGFDEDSFAFNTRAEPSLFERQFDLFNRLRQLSVDLYGYVTFTSPDVACVREAMPRFVDRLQQIHEKLPLRIVPLKIEVFAPVVARLDAVRREALQNQKVAAEAWQKELQLRFPASALAEDIVDIKLHS